MTAPLALRARRAREANSPFTYLFHTTMADKPNILLVEDDPNLGFVVQDNLKKGGFKVHLCRDGKEGLKAFNETSYDLCVLDVMLPQKDGFSLARDIRSVNNDVPILFLTAKAMIEDKTTGFEAGGDDYLTKPFEMKELILRANALLKRGNALSVEESEDTNGFTIGAYTFDSENFMLSINGDSRKLTKKEAGVLKLLCEHKNQVIQRELILNMVWGDDSYFNGRSLDVFITKLRKYLKEDEAVSISNVHGVGFKLEG